MAKNNAFDDLLASFQDESDRQAISGLAEKYPTLRESVMLRSDYSRKMDEAKSKVDYAEKMGAWYQEHWVPNAYGDGRGATKRELEKDQQLSAAQQRLSELESQIQVGGDVTFDQLSEYIGKQGFVPETKVNELVETRVKSERQSVEQYLAGLSHIATKAPKLATRHLRVFNEELDTDQLVEFANKNGVADLERAYDLYTADKRQAAQEAALRNQVEAETRKKVEEEFAAKGGSRSMPTDETGPEMGHFQRRVMGLDKAEGSAVPESAELGRGAIAHVAAREMGNGGA